MYHAKAKDYLSSHQLADFRKCPLLFYRKRQGLIADGDRPAYLVGRAAHTLILEGDAKFDAEYTVGGPINPKTGQPYGPTTKAFAEWARTIGKQILTDSQYELVTNMHLSVLQHEVAKTCGGRDPRRRRSRRVLRRALPIRMDWYDAFFGIVDLKTCDDLTWFESDARRFGYVYQLAFYRAVLAQVIGISAPVHLIAVEKKEPYRCGVWKISNESLGLAQKTNEAAIAQLRDCMTQGQWPRGTKNPGCLTAWRNAARSLLLLSDWKPLEDSLRALNSISNPPRKKARAPPHDGVGVQGVGKSTFAALRGQTHLIPTEDGLGNIDCDSFPVAQSFEDVLEVFGTLPRTGSLLSDVGHRFGGLAGATDLGGRLQETRRGIDRRHRLRQGLQLRPQTVAGCHQRPGSPAERTRHGHHSDRPREVERFENPETDTYDHTCPASTKPHQPCSKSFATKCSSPATACTPL